MNLVDEVLAQPTPFLQRFTLLKGAGETTNWALFLARWLEDKGPVTRREAEVVAAKWAA